MGDTLSTGPAPTTSARVRTGIDALLDLFVAQMERDRAQGLATEALVTGYEGSPLAGLDLAMLRDARRLDGVGVHFQPGLNEDLAATAVWGTQTVPRMRPGLDGVVGYWFGKAPGLDRSADALRHAHAIGTSPTGGALLLVGDDPACKSSTLPSNSVPMLSALGIPVLYPGSVDDIVELGLLGIDLSRESGAYVALKLDTDLLDGFTTITSDAAVPVPSRRLDPRSEADGWRHRQIPLPVPPHTVRNQADVLHHRLAVAEGFARRARITRTLGDASDTRVGFIASGMATSRVVAALTQLGAMGARDHVGVLDLRMSFPPDAESIQGFAARCDTIIVVEEGRPRLEDAVKAALFAVAQPPRVIGRLDEQGRPFLPWEGEVDIARLATSFTPVLQRITQLDLQVPAASRQPRLLPLVSARTPFFCSGCPHNRSTATPAGALLGAGIGCHGMVAFIHDDRRAPDGMTHMGGEGAAWVGQARFSESQHMIQNIGDGTFFHSGSLALRFAVASQTNITYKILYNQAVAMTGGQDAAGSLTVPELCRLLKAEGVVRVVVCHEDPKRYPHRKTLPRGVELRHRDDILAVQEELASVPGVTALIYDQQCAAEARRERRQGLKPTPARRIVINERVCEGCGDCGARSNCLSVQPVETRFGRKTRIDQDSCNYDASCLDGDCPSFVSVVVDPTRVASRQGKVPPSDLPAAPRAEGSSSVLLAGIGGTGVVSCNRLLARAAALSGIEASGLDQTGLSQKAGPVVSHLRLGSSSSGSPSAVQPGTADVLLVFDPLVAVDERNLAKAARQRTVAVIARGVVPTGAMVRDVHAPVIDEEALVDAIDDATTPGRNLRVPSQDIASRIVGDALLANSVLIGAALQAGLLPVSHEALMAAVAETGRSAATTMAAIDWGRTFVARPQVVLDMLAEGRPTTIPVDPGIGAHTAELGLPAMAQSVVAELATDLMAYQGRRLAATFLKGLGNLFAVEDALGTDGAPVTVAAARGLHKVMAYKDEYEVARLHLDPAFEAMLAREVGPGTVRYHLHPPILRAMGLKKKLVLGPWAKPGFRILRVMRHLRGTPVDPFGYAKVRRTEMALIDEYMGLIRLAEKRLTHTNIPEVVELLSSVDMVRGYEEIKLANVDHYRERVDGLIAGLDQPRVDGGSANET